MSLDDQTEHGRAANVDGNAAPSTPAARGSVGRLAASLGINRRTIGKLRLRGAPAGVDEREWRAWCSREGIRNVRPPMTVELDVAAPRGTSADAASKPGPSGLLAAPESHAQLKNQRDAELKSLQAVKCQIEIDEKRRVLVHRDDVAALVRGVAAAVVNELIDLPPRSIADDALSLPVEWRRPVRRAIERQVDALRQRLVAGLGQRVRAALGAASEVGA